VRGFAPPRRDWPLVAAGAVLFFLAYPPFHLFIPSFLCLMPVAWLVLDAQHDPQPLRRHLLQGFWFGMAGYGLVLYWIVGALWHFTALAALGFLATILILALYTACVFALSGWVTRRTNVGLVLTLPVIWTAAEWAVGHQGDVRFPWLGLGTSLTGFPTVVQIADVIGARGITFALVAANVALAVAWHRRRERRMMIAHAGAVVVGVLLALLYGAARERALPLERVGVVAVLQPNVGWEEKRAVGQRQRIFDRTLDLARRAVNETHPDLVVWPEAAAPGYLTRRPQWTRAIAELAHSTRVPQLVGGLDLEFLEPTDAAEPPPYRHFNAAFLFDSLGRYDAQPVYHKQYLVPVTERVPFVPPDWLDVNILGSFTAGYRRPVYETATGSFGVIICYESAFEELVRDYRVRGADAILNITNDVWFGRTSAPYQHMAHLVMRAIENRVGIARAANSGISGFVDPLGRPSLQTGLFTETFVRGEVLSVPGLTPYTRLGDWVGVSTVILTVLLIGHALRRRP
jgi:apolipoprotein N-acyltransferase